MAFHSILYPSPENEEQAGDCPWLSFFARRPSADEACTTHGNKTYAAYPNNLTETRTTPAFFADTGLDLILDEVLAGREEDALRRVFYALSAGAETVAYRQEVMRALEQREIAGIVRSFCRAVESAERTMADSQKVYAPAQRRKYAVDGAVAYCDAVRGLLAAASARDLPSEGLGAFVGAVRAYASGREFADAEALLRRAKEAVETVSFSLRIRKGRVIVGPGGESGDFVRDTWDDFACTGECAGNPPREIRLFGELELGPLGILIADALQGEHPAAFALLHTAAEAASRIPAPFIRAFTEEIRFYFRYLDMAEAVRAKGLPFAYPVLSGCDTVRIEGAYDLDLALKQEGVVPNDCSLTAEERGIVVTGANHSGKTTYIRSIGQIAALAALGLPVPCRSAEIPLFRSLYSHFSDAEEGDARQGRLKEELIKLKPILAAAGMGSLVLLNEMFSSTTAQDAQAMAARVLGGLTGGGARVLCVTHVVGSVPDNMVSMAAQVVPDSRERLYTVVRAPAETHAHVEALMEAYHLTYPNVRERIGHGV